MNTENLIEEIVRRRMGKREMFTAFEVSLEIQDSTKESGRHRELKQYIHNTVEKFIHEEFDNYTSTVRDVGAPVPAVVYHPYDSDVSEYVPLKRRDGTFDQGVAIKTVSVKEVPHPAIANNVLTTVKQGGVKLQDLVATAYELKHGEPLHPDGAFTKDSRGRLYVPKEFVDKLGANKINVLCDDGRIMLTALNGSNLAHTVYTREPDGNIRVTNRLLEKAKLGDAEAFSITVGESCVVIKKA